MTDRWTTRKTSKTRYVASLLKSLRKLSRVLAEKRYEERHRVSPCLDFSRFVGGHFSYAKAPKQGFTRLSRLSRRTCWPCPSRREEWVH